VISGDDLVSDQKEMPTMMDVSVEPRLAIPNAQAAIEQVNR